MKIRQLALAASVCALAAALMAQAPNPANVDWEYNGGAAADHFSPLTQVTRENVSRLREAWRFPMAAGGLQSQPMMIGRTLYVLTTRRELVALDAATGKQKWLFDPKLEGYQPIRGLTHWRDGDRLRIVFGRENFLYLVDAETGQPVPGFGDNGRIDVRENLRGRAEDNNIFLTSPVMVYRDLLIVNGRLAEHTPASPGDVRAFDARTGKLVWTFHTIPHPGEEGAETWPADAHLTQGGANAWSGASIDVARGIVFVNTGSAADDFYGAMRPGDNRFANSTIALDANTGKRLWDFQQVHHDIWDSDSTSPPILMSLNHEGRMVDVAVATNKQSFLYVFDRVTGRPLHPIEEQPVPATSDVPGEILSKTQPVPTFYKPLSRRTITEADLTTASPELNAAARAAFAKLYRAGEAFAPLGLNQDTLVVPGFGGGNEWGGMATDREGVIYAQVANAASLTRLEENPRLKPGHKDTVAADQNGYQNLRYSFTGYGSFRVNGQPAIGEPLNLLKAVDLNTGQERWSIPYIPTSNGGPVVTASGLLFTGSSGNMRAYDTRNGNLLWEQRLPALAGLSPAVYMVDGKQYVALAAAGRGNAAYIAYALPD